MLFLGGGYIILASGSDYPLKTNTYIRKFFIKNYPCNFFAFLSFDNLDSYGQKFKKMCFSNRNNYWISFHNTKFKLEIKPFCYVRPRCFKGQKIPWKEIFYNFPKIFKFFFTQKNLKILKLEWCTSETWMELTYSTVNKLINYIDKNLQYIIEIGKYIHNPEECLLQSIINTIEKEIPRQDYLVNCEMRLRKSGSLEITDEDDDFVFAKLKDPNWLFMRKFSSDRSLKILDFIDKETK